MSRGVPCCSDAGGRRVFGGQCGLTHETCDIQRTGEDIAPVLRLGTVGHAEPGRTIEVSPGLVGVAAFGITEPTDAQVPGGLVSLSFRQERSVMLGMLSSDNEKEQGRATGFVRKSTDFIGFCTELAKETFYQIRRANVRVQLGIKLIV
jgi:hypothetical protein